MTVTPFDLVGGPGDPDVPQSTSVAGSGSDFTRAVAHAFGRASDALQRAESAESAFVAGRGGLQEMVLERARADVALSIASATTSHVAQSLQTILGMQV